MTSKYSICPKCMECRKLTRHHIFPRRFFGKSNNILYICRKCHDEIETIIPRHNKLTKIEYKKLHKQWLTEEFYNILDEVKMTNPSEIVRMPDSDWWRLNTAKDCTYKIEWTPKGGGAVRAKLDSISRWDYDYCSSGKWAESRGLVLIARQEKERCI